MIESFQKNATGHKEGRKRGKTNFNRDKRIYELSLTELTHPEISRKIKEEFGGRTISYDEVAKIVQRMKKKIMDI